VYEESNGVTDRVERLDETVERMTTEVASLKLEVATLVSALRENQTHHAQRPAVAPLPLKKAAPPSRPSPAPAAVVVLLATGLLSWQLIMGPRPEDGAQASAGAPSAVSRNADARTITPPPPTIDTATEPPVTPLVKPTIYKGTLAVAADRPGSRVYVNRQEVGVAPVRVRNLKAGAHLVWIESEGFRRWTRVVTVPAERVTRVSADLEPVEPVIEH
jgi:hypothetical protein